MLKISQTWLKNVRMGHDDVWSQPMNPGNTEPPNAAISEVPADAVDVPEGIPPISSPVQMVVVENTSPSSTVADWETEAAPSAGPADRIQREQSPRDVRESQATLKNCRRRSHGGP